MFINPIGIGAELVRKSVESQLSLAMSMAGKLFNASLQLGELNRQAGRRLVEESAADLQRAMQIRTLADAQSFIGDQSKMSIDKVRGYWQNVQNIAAENWIGAMKQAEAAAARTQAESGPRSSDEQEEQPSAAPHKQQHEADPHPSPLVEKLIASVATDGDRHGAQ